MVKKAGGERTEALSRRPISVNMSGLDSQSRRAELSYESPTHSLYGRPEASSRCAVAGVNPLSFGQLFSTTRVFKNATWRFANLGPNRGRFGQEEANETLDSEDGFAPADVGADNDGVCADSRSGRRGCLRRLSDDGADHYVSGQLSRQPDLNVALGEAPKGASPGAAFRLPEEMKSSNRDSLRYSRAQTMTEYAMITATIIAVLIAFYDNAGSLIQLIVGQVGGVLTSQIH